MRAAQIHEVGGLPAVSDAEAPAGEDVVEVLAAPVNPIDLAVSRGILATGHPPLPYVPGCEGVGRKADGKVVWVFGGGLGRTANGAMAERAAIGDAMAIPVPDGADPAVAAGLGIAGLAGWLPLAWRATGTVPCAISPASAAWDCRSGATASPLHPPSPVSTFVGWQEPIGCGGVAVFPDDVIVADEDGAVVIPAALLDEVLAAGPEQERYEAWVVAEVERGIPLPGLPNAETKARNQAFRASR